MATKDSIENEIYDYELKEAQKRWDIIEPVKFAQLKTRYILKFHGYDKCYNCDKKFNEIDISYYLGMIENEYKEYSQILAIKDGMIQGNILVVGDNNAIHADSYFKKNKLGESAVEFINKWHDKKAQICNYHNHPLRVAAIPSNNDIDSFGLPHLKSATSKNEWTKCARIYGIDIPNNFCYDDWGVVTFCDFFSYKQKIEIIIIYLMK